MNILRVVIIGQAEFGRSVLERLTKATDYEVCGVFTPPDKENATPNSMNKLANELNIQCFQFPKLKTAIALDTFTKLKPGLCVMAYVTDIVPVSMLNIPGLGTIQYHPSLLPKHRGPSAINWAIIQGYTQTGITIFWPDKGLDTGPILMQDSVEIKPDDTVGTLYFNKLFPMGVDALERSVSLVKTGKAPKVSQQHDQATYQGWCRRNDAMIEWDKPLNSVFNLIRGCDPQPGARTFFEDKEIALYSCKKVESLHHSGTQPGRVVEVDSLSFYVAVRGGVIQVGRVREFHESLPKSKKVSAAQWAKSVNLKTHSILGR